MKLACEKCAPTEHISYMSAATEAAEIVESRRGTRSTLLSFNQICLFQCRGFRGELHRPNPQTHNLRKPVAFAV